MEKCVRSTVIAFIWIPTLSLPSYVALDTLVDLWKHFFKMEPWRSMLILGETRNSVDYIVDFLGWRCPWQSRWGLLLRRCFWPQEAAERFSYRLWIIHIYIVVPVYHLPTVCVWERERERERKILFPLG